MRHMSINTFLNPQVEVLINFFTERKLYEERSALIALVNATMQNPNSNELKLIGDHSEEIVKTILNVMGFGNAEVIPFTKSNSVIVKLYSSQ